MLPQDVMMNNSSEFGIEVTLLTGRYIATSYSNRKSHEWPPHPARLYSALVAVWAESGNDEDERDALEWLESLGPPEISSSTETPRSVKSHFVPVNDTTIFGRAFYNRRAVKINNNKKLLEVELKHSSGKLTRKAKSLERAINREREVTNQVSSRGKTPHELAEEFFEARRKKQERFFPSCTPHSKLITYSWQTRVPRMISETLDQLLSRVHRIGHSSSFVSCRLVDRAPTPSLIPNPQGEVELRTIGSGQLKTLKQMYQNHRGVDPRVLPNIATTYGRPRKTKETKEKIIPNTAGGWIVYEFSHQSRYFPVTRVVEIASFMRKAIFHYASSSLNEEFSGHAIDGSPTLKTHLAIVPLPFVEFPYADGRILGLAVIVPNSINSNTKNAIYRALGNWEKVRSNQNMAQQLNMGELGRIQIVRLLGTSSIISLRKPIWAKRSKSWTTATPIALPRHPGSLSRGTYKSRSKAWRRASASINLACSHVNLPPPLKIECSLTPLISGARPVIHYPAFYQDNRDGTRIRRQLVHAKIEFEEEVSGPLIIGSGRFFGLGLMRPIKSKSE